MNAESNITENEKTYIKEFIDEIKKIYNEYKKIVDNKTNRVDLFINNTLTYIKSKKNINSNTSRLIATKIYETLFTEFGKQFLNSVNMSPIIIVDIINQDKKIFVDNLNVLNVLIKYILNKKNYNNDYKLSDEDIFDNITKGDVINYESSTPVVEEIGKGGQDGNAKLFSVFLKNDSNNNIGTKYLLLRTPGINGDYFNSFNEETKNNPNMVYNLIKCIENAEKEVEIGDSERKENLNNRNNSDTIEKKKQNQIFSNDDNKKRIDEYDFDEKPSNDLNDSDKLNFSSDPIRDNAHPDRKYFIFDNNGLGSLVVVTTHEGSNSPLRLVLKGKSYDYFYIKNNTLFGFKKNISTPLQPNVFLDLEVNVKFPESSNGGNKNINFQQNPLVKNHRKNTQNRRLKNRRYTIKRSNRRKY